MDAAAEIGRDPVSKHQIQPEYGDEQADAGRYCRARLARPNSQALTGTGKFLVVRRGSADEYYICHSFLPRKPGTIQCYAILLYVIVIMYSRTCKCVPWFRISS